MNPGRLKEEGGRMNARLRPHSAVRCPPSAFLRGFTLIELLAVLAIIVLLAATFVPYALSLRETDNRVRCAANLRNLWWAFNEYAGRNGGAFPRTRADDHLGGRWTAFTGADDANPFAADSAVRPNDVTASLWLLVRTVDAKTEWFVCPSSDGTRDLVEDAAGRPVDARSRGNFRSAAHLTYAVASPFSGVPEYALNDTLPSGFVIIADQGPSIDSLAPGRAPAADASPRALAMGNSVNHRRGGQNVLYPQGTVIFETTPYCGVGRVRSGDRTLVPGDNIYTALAATPLVDVRPTHSLPGVAGTDLGPSYRYDTLLVPGADFAAAARAAHAPVTTVPAVVVPPEATSRPTTLPDLITPPPATTAPLSTTSPATTQAS